MRLLTSANGRAPAEKLTLANGIPVTIALQYSTGKQVESRIPGAADQMFYTLTDGRTMYLPLEVAGMIDELQLQSREPFTICKYGPREWQVERVNPYAAPPEQPPPAAAQAEPPQRKPPAAAAATASEPEPSTKLEHALKTAILAASNAEKYGQSIGYTVRFDTDAIKAMAITVLINMEGGRK